MAELCLPLKQTHIAPGDLYVAMRDAWVALMAGEPCNRASLLTLLAQSALETGFWRACWNLNLGNIKHFAGDGHDYTMIRLNEVINGKTVWFDPPDPTTWLRAYSDLDASLRDYLIALRGRFRAAWPAVLAGDPAEFSHQLKLARYYTADEAIYTAGILRCYHQLDATIPPDPASVPTQPELPGGESGSADGDPEDPLPHVPEVETKDDGQPPPEAA